MDTHLEHALTHLDEGALLRIHDGQGKAIAVFSGLVWITQDNDTRDVILGDGESFTFDRPGLAIVQALRPSKLLTFERGPRAATRDAPDPTDRIGSEQLHRQAQEMRAHAIAHAVGHILPRLRSALG